MITMCMEWVINNLLEASFNAKFVKLFQNDIVDDISEKLEYGYC